MAADADTIVAIKSSFLSAQTKILSRRLVLPESVRSRTGVPDRALDVALKEVNRVVRRHNTSTYDELAIRAIAEQIDTLYWEASAPDLDEEDELFNDDELVRHGDDFTTQRMIDKLPSSLSSDDTYESLVLRLQSLVGRRDELRSKVDRYRQLQRALAPLRDAQRKIQPNLVSRDGPLEEELGRSKVLGIRVAGKVAGLQLDGPSAEPGADDGNDKMAIVDEDEKLKRLLA